MMIWTDALRKLRNTYKAVYNKRNLTDIKDII